MSLDITRPEPAPTRSRPVRPSSLRQLEQRRSRQQKEAAQIARALIDERNREEFGAPEMATDARVALTPATTALLAIPLLGEWPSAVDWMAIALISLGVYVVTGGSAGQNARSLVLLSANEKPAR
jgi:hypothetical protein